MARSIRKASVAEAVRALAVLLVLQGGAAAFAQASQPAEPEVSMSVRDVTRLESWSFFEPRQGGGDPTYTFIGNRATLGVRVSGHRFDFDGAFQYAQIVGLPRRSSGPGPLGTGALYYDAARATRAYQLYFKTLSLGVKNIAPGLSVTIGRMGYGSGAEIASGVPSIEAVKRLGLESRLVGESEWSIFQRAFDGAKATLDRTSWALTGAVLFPTQGGFEESANATIDRLRTATAVLTLKPALLARSEAQLFAYHYRDRRDVRARPDNVGIPLRAVNISITTIGGSQVGVFPVARGELDTLLWVAGQTGDWYGQSHRGLAVAAEAGYRWTAGWRPWLRGGLLRASGDHDPRDDRHETFFQMLPTSRRYSLSATYAQMNLRDTFVQFLLRPHPRVNVRTDLHRLRLDRVADRWYSGSGATARRGTDFGYSHRPSMGSGDLGTIGEGSVDVTLGRRWSVNAYVGLMKGGEIVRRLFLGDRLRFFYLENVLTF